MATNSGEDAEDWVAYCVVSNIPTEYHSVHLRNFFAQMIESNGFMCFHFRHRPEAIHPTTTERSFQITSEDEEGDPPSDEDKVSRVERFRRTKRRKKLTSRMIKNEKKTMCCFVQLMNSQLERFIRLYHRKHWLDENGDSIPSLCAIFRLKVPQSNYPLDIEATEDDGNSCAVQRVFSNEQEQFTLSDLDKLREFHPPDIMPQGNVGTPTRVFFELIRECKLPKSMIKRLGLTFAKTRAKNIFGTVAFSYGGEVNKGGQEEETATAACGKELEDETVSVPQPGMKSVTNSLKSSADKGPHAKRRRRKKNKAGRGNTPDIEGREPNEKSEEDQDDCEEWERHEALHDDPANVERNKERLFEEELEVQWEKGGSGLVFYTDAQYWDQEKGDFDEQTADDWDVDMSAYYDPDGGDKDARDFITMRQEQRRRQGEEDTDRYTAGIGKFEKHTKGIGRKLMEKHGWREGQGLGKSSAGMVDALENEGQVPRDRKGLGYRGEKLQRYGDSHMQRGANQHLISTIYDNPTQRNTERSLVQRHDPYYMGISQSHEISPQGQHGRDQQRTSVIYPNLAGPDLPGPSLQRHRPYPWGQAHHRQRENDQHIISTVYDNCAYMNPVEPLLRRSEPHPMKYRDSTSNAYR